MIEGFDSKNIKKLGTMENAVLCYCDVTCSCLFTFSGNFLWMLGCKYWIFVCASMFLVISIQEAVIYRIIYMILFLYFVISFQVRAHLL